MGFGTLAKPEKGLKSRAYRDWIHELPCIQCMIEGRETYGVDPAHVSHAFPSWDHRGKGAKASDLRVTPSCRARDRHVNLIPATRALLQASGRPYVIENVRQVRKHLIKPVSLFGTMFDLHMVTSAGQRFVLSRERLFETNWGLVAPDDPGAQGYPIANVFGGHLRCRSKGYRTGNGTGRTRDFIGEDKPALARQLMEMPWASMGEMSEAVPPAFTRFIGAQLRAVLDAERSAA